MRDTTPVSAQKNREQPSFSLERGDVARAFGLNIGEPFTCMRV